MIDFDSALDLAEEYFEAHGMPRAAKIYEEAKKWVVYAESEDEQDVKFNKDAVEIDKETGEVKLFEISSQEEFELLLSAKLTEL